MKDQTATKQDIERIIEAMISIKSEMDKRFNEVDKRFNLIDKRFDEVDKRFYDVDRRFGEVDKRFGEVDKRFSDIDNRFGEVDKALIEINHFMRGVLFDQLALVSPQVREHDDQITYHTALIGDLDMRVKVLEKHN